MAPKQLFQALQAGVRFLPPWIGQKVGTVGVGKCIWQTLPVHVHGYMALHGASIANG